MQSGTKIDLSDPAYQLQMALSRWDNEGGAEPGSLPERGRPAPLDEQQLAALRGTLLRSPGEQGFGTEL